ncbi:MAG: hypothetical protein IAC54_08715 [Bacteroidetes bacterium]|uniref:Uncharacterized protein n=1 Tax=Candidatus Caccoplasma merdipullorum TaxID=2840718 RepID=A0A9D9E5U6_9BACT|nr:hypothetical protein [Candidatus Caccoplasma merdipullorum]
MKRSCFKKEKEEDFIKAYEEELKSLGDIAPYLSREAIINRALHSGKGRYYISFDEAARNVRKIINKHPISCKNLCKASMYEELSRKVMDYLKKRPNSTYREALYTLLAEDRASRFFFGVQTARLILDRNRSRKRNVAVA